MPAVALLTSFGLVPRLVFGKRAGGSSCRSLADQRLIKMSERLASIILAAGLGTRMRSARAKVLHELAGEPIIAHSIRTHAALGARPLIVVVGHQAREVEAAARRACPIDALAFAAQTDQ